MRDFYLTGVTRYRGTEISAWGFYATNTCLVIKAKGNVPTAGKKRKKVYITEQGLELGLITRDCFATIATSQNTRRFVRLTVLYKRY